MDLDYFYKEQAEMFAFYRIPMMLFTRDCFKELSCEAKLLYGILLSRMELSRKNGWLDQNGNVYIYFTIEEIMDALKCAHGKAGHLLKELVDIGLLEKKRQGLGQPDRLYLKNFSRVDEVQFQKADFRTSGNLQSGC